VRFETVVQVERDAFGAESLERPVLVATDDGGWRLYVSAATPGTAHWRVDVLEAPTVARLGRATPRTVLPGSAVRAVKDPVLARDGDGGWHLWASVHPLDDPLATDRMSTEHATSDDGLSWTWHGVVLAPRAGSWDARGTRLSSVMSDGTGLLAVYDGRATAEENWEERTGLAVTDGHAGRFHPLDDGPMAQSPYGLGGLRYVSLVPLPDGGIRAYAEVTRSDGAHELRTVAVPTQD
jgi:hypothetical protein